jgi:hypothetical protein
MEESDYSHNIVNVYEKSPSRSNRLHINGNNLKLLSRPFTIILLQKILTFKSSSYMAHV